VIVTVPLSADIAVIGKSPLVRVISVLLYVIDQVDVSSVVPTKILIPVVAFVNSPDKTFPSKSA
jgi:hypothetical protein